MFIGNQICNKLGEYYQNDVSYYIDDEINKQEYISLVENHHKLFLQKKQVNDELEKYTNMYTTVQRSLLNKYKVFIV